MRRITLSLLAILVLAGLAGCGNDGLVAPGTTGTGPPPPGGNPGGAAFPLQATVQRSRTIGHAPMPVNMWANVIGGVAPYYYRWDVNGDGGWDFGGDGVVEVGVTYASAGLYDILLEVEDSFGQFYQATALVDVKPSGPVAVPVALPAVGNAPLSVTLDGSSSYDNDGYVVLYEWDMESDGVYDHESETDPTYAAEYSQGTHNATLRVTDDDGLESVASVQIIAL